MPLKKVGNIYGGGGGMKKVGNLYDSRPPQQQQQSSRQRGGAWNTFTRNIIKPVAAASNLMEDTGKTIGYGISKAIRPSLNWSDVKKRGGIDLWGHQKDVWQGKNQRTYSDIMKEISAEEKNPVMRTGMKTAGYAGDFVLDPLNKLKLLGLTGKGTKALKSGGLALSAGDQATQGQRAIAQFGKRSILPGAVDKAFFKGSTKLNDAVRGTTAGAKMFDTGAKMFGKIRPSGVSRGEFKTITAAKTAGRNTSEFAKTKAIEMGKNLEKMLRKRKVTDIDRTQLLHAIEKGDGKLTPKGLGDIFKEGVRFKNANSEQWSKLGGSLLEGHGLSHVATDAVAEGARKKALKGGKLFSSMTPQDIHRQWVKLGDNAPKNAPSVASYVDQDGEKIFTRLRQGELDKLNNETVAIPKAKKGYSQIHLDADDGMLRKAGVEVPRDSFVAGHPQAQEVLDVASSNRIANIGKEGIKYKPNLYDKGKGGYIDKAGNPVNVSQASAKEINEEAIKAGGKEIFKEDLPTVVAKMGISTGNKKAGVEFLEATKGITSKTGKELVNETYEKMTNIEAIRKAVQGFDKVQNIWKAQALLAPAYHVRNVAGNLWNNYLAGVSPTDYAKAGRLQKKLAAGKLPKADAELMMEIQKNGVAGTGWFGKDITQAIADEIGKGSANPFSQRFVGYRMNRSLGSAVEDNAKIAHFLTKRREGTAKYAADSVKKYLFDYGDLTDFERQGMKRLMPFYTWTSKNIPLQVKEFFENPGKFSKIGVGKKLMESGVPEQDEKYLSDYISSNSPIRVRDDGDGNTQYFLLGQWLPSAQAMDFLSQPTENIIGMISPALKLPLETILNKSSYFKDTLGDYSDLQKYQGQTKSYAGLDLNPKTVNAIRSIRLLNELNKLNPGEVFGSKEEGSIWNKLGVDIGSENRGTKYTPDSDQLARTLSVLAGKTATYNPENSKFFYDRDTSSRKSDMKLAIKNALRKGHTKRATDTKDQLQEFLETRKGKLKPYY